MATFKVAGSDKISVDLTGVPENLHQAIRNTLDAMVGPYVADIENRITSYTFRFAALQPSFQNAIAVASQNTGPNPVITFNLNTLGLESNILLFRGTNNSIRGYFDDTTIHETLHVVYPGLTDPRIHNQEFRTAADPLAIYSGILNAQGHPDYAARARAAAGEIAFAMLAIKAEAALSADGRASYRERDFFARSARRAG